MVFRTLQSSFLNYFRHRSTTPTRSYHDYIRVASNNGTLRIPLSSQKVIGIASSRGNRSHQEDFHAFASLSLEPEELKLSVQRSHGLEWDPTAVGDSLSRQIVFVGLYDGHGGSAVSQYLRQELHGLLESATTASIPELYTWVTHEVGGYFKRFKGGALSPWIDGQGLGIMDLEARATTAFFEVDRNLSVDDFSQTCGATASVALLHALDAPSAPFFSAQTVALTVAHCGDTRVLLCPTVGPDAFPMTETHHAEAHVEAIRLRRMMGSSLMTDSFGETRWMGALMNTRCLGDLRYKRFGVTPEPEVRTKLLQNGQWASIVLVSDGVTSILSDNEIIDIARNSPDPKSAAQNVLAFSQELGGDDNATAIVLPLAGWGKVKGQDGTKELREYRRRQAVGSERQRRM